MTDNQLPDNRDVTLRMQSINPVLAKLLGVGGSETVNPNEVKVTLTDNFFYMDPNDPTQPSPEYKQFVEDVFGERSRVQSINIIRPSGRTVEISVQPDLSTEKINDCIFVMIQGLFMP